MLEITIIAGQVVQHSRGSTVISCRSPLIRPRHHEVMLDPWPPSSTQYGRLKPPKLPKTHKVGKRGGFLWGYYPLIIFNIRGDSFYMFLISPNSYSPFTAVGQWSRNQRKLCDAWAIDPSANPQGFWCTVNVPAEQTKWPCLPIERSPKNNRSTSRNIAIHATATARWRFFLGCPVISTQQSQPEKWPQSGHKATTSHGSPRCDEQMN